MIRGMRENACERFIMVVEFPNESHWPPHTKCPAVEVCFRDDAFEELANGARCKVIGLPEYVGLFEPTEGWVNVDLEGRAYIEFENKTDRQICIPAGSPVAILEIIPQEGRN